MCRDTDESILHQDLCWCTKISHKRSFMHGGHTGNVRDVIRAPHIATQDFRLDFALLQRSCFKFWWFWFLWIILGVWSVFLEICPYSVLTEWKRCGWCGPELSSIHVTLARQSVVGEMAFCVRSCYCYPIFSWAFRWKQEIERFVWLRGSLRPLFSRVCRQKDFLMGLNTVFLKSRRRLFGPHCVDNKNRVVPLAVI